MSNGVCCQLVVVVSRVRLFAGCCCVVYVDCCLRQCVVACGSLRVGTDVCYIAVVCCWLLYVVRCCRLLVLLCVVCGWSASLLAGGCLVCTAGGF